ncbi:MAG TPA: hypothetical protein VGR37_02250 [Longimicrobiaceae bacterium]|nr:hypothetical protein [Longimicrobiaceae bacterium]
MAPAPSPSGPRPAALALVRLAILTAVLGFGAVVWYLQRQPGWAPSAVDRDTLSYVSLAVWVLAGGGVLLVRSLQRRQADPGRARPLLVAGWALGEVTALWGGVYYLLTGDPQRYFTGLIFLALVFLMFPVPGRR